MPDWSGRCDRVDMCGRFASTSRGNPTVGGIRRGKRYKSYVVNIRFPKWKKRIWIGKLGSFRDAQYVADAVFYYIGKPPFHFKEAVMTYPSLTCMGIVNGNPEMEVLSTRKMFSRYVGSIAKGEEFEPQREEFMKLVEDVTRRPDFPFLAASQEKVVVVDDDDRDREEEAPPMEFDENAAKALQMSSRQCLGGVPTTVVLTHVSGFDTVSGSGALLTSRHAYVPSVEFDLGGSENILRSADQSLDLIRFSTDDCPTTLPEDETKLRIWNETVEVLDKWSAGGTFTPSVVSNAGEVYQEGYEITSPIFNIPPTVYQFGSPSSKTALDFVAPVECTATSDNARGISEDWPLLQFATNSKRQKIGD